MMKTIRRKRGFSGEQGIALILTLLMLALVTLLAIGFTASMRVENMASQNFDATIRARQVALTGLNEAIFTLRRNTQGNYRSQPGRLTIGTGTKIPLYSSTGTEIVNINRDPASTTLGAIYRSAADNIDVTWINITTNGQVAASGGTDPVIARYCWYADDEATKVNINGAFRPSPDNFGTIANVASRRFASGVALRALFEDANPQDQINTPGLAYDEAATNIFSYGSRTGFVSPYETEIMFPRSGGSAATENPVKSAGMQVDARNITICSAEDQPLTPWGAPRVLLDGSVTLESITNALSDANLGTWFSSAKLFKDKYDLLQIAANIVDFIDNKSICTDSGAGNDTTPPNYLGLEITPYLNELVITNTTSWVPCPTNASLWRVTNITQINTELWNPYPTNHIAANSLQVVWLNMPNLTNSHNVAQPVTSLDCTSAISDGTTIPLTNLYVAPFAKTTVYDSATPPNTLPATMSLSSSIVTGILRNAEGRMDYARFTFPAKTWSITASPTVVFAGGVACNDPRIRPVSTNWFSETTETLGATNSQINFLTGNGPTLLGDGDWWSHIETNRDRGTLNSVGELGYIHVGNVPWRTLRLQPQVLAERNAPFMPDWAVLDLFTTSSGPVSGKININARMYPAGFVRTVPLLGAIFGSTNNGSGYAINSRDTNVVKCLADMTAATSWVNPSFAWPCYLAWPDRYNTFSFIGELCEIRGMATNIWPDNIVNDATKEKRIRRLANLVTTRSNAFKITCVGQTVHPDSSNGYVVTGEARLEAIVEKNSSGYLVRSFRYLN